LGHNYIANMNHGGDHKHVHELRTTIIARKKRAKELEEGKLVDGKSDNEDEDGHKALHLAAVERGQVRRGEERSEELATLIGVPSP